MLFSTDLKGLEETLGDKLNNDLIESALSSRHICVNLPEGGVFMGFRYCEVIRPLKVNDQVYIYVTKENLYLFTDNAKLRGYLGLINRPLGGYGSLAMFFQLMTEKDIDSLDKIEKLLTKMEDRIINPKNPGSIIIGELIKQRRALLKIKRYYAQLSIVVGEMLAGTFDIDPKDKSALKAIDRRFGHLLDTVISMREYTGQVREAYQAQIDIEQNQIMKIFTVLTAVFSPLTLIVGWYGMNFSMPEYAWRYGYLYVIILSIVTLIICIYIFHKNKWY